MVAMNSMEKKAAARAYLSREPYKNVDMLCLLDQTRSVVDYAGDDGVLMHLPWVYLLSSDKACAERLYGKIAAVMLRKNASFVSHGFYIDERLEAECDVCLHTICHHYVYASDARIAYSLPQNAEILPLKQRHADFVHAHYHTVDSLDYIRFRIRAGMFGAFVNGELVGFIGTHGEGAMGLLEILPDYRKLGLAFALEAHLTNSLLDAGRLPFGQVYNDNLPSIRLQEKLGFTVFESACRWITPNGEH